MPALRQPYAVHLHPSYNSTWALISSTPQKHRLGQRLLDTPHSWGSSSHNIFPPIKTRVSDAEQPGSQTHCLSVCISGPDRPAVQSRGGLPPQAADRGALTVRTEGGGHRCSQTRLSALMLHRNIPLGVLLILPLLVLL